jgi:hypothetical protein
MKTSLANTANPEALFLIHFFLGKLKVNFYIKRDSPIQAFSGSPAAPAHALRRFARTDLRSSRDPPGIQRI